MTETTDICPDPINCPGAGGPHEHVQEPGKFCEGCGSWSTETDVQGLGLDCCATQLVGPLSGGDSSEQVENEFTLEGRFLWPSTPQASVGRTITMEVHMHSTERDQKGHLRWLRADGTR